MKLTDSTVHRPYPLPAGPWIMAQTWSHLLFAHWPISPDALRGKIPIDLKLDTFDGHAWLSIVPFAMKNIHMRLLPPLPYTTDFTELNVRTYVTANGKPGVCFFSLDASSKLAVTLARRFFHLPYFNAKMEMQVSNDETVQYHSERIHPHSPQGSFSAIYRPTSTSFRTRTGTLEEWLTERYCLYSWDKNGQIYRGDIHHLPWELQQAEADIYTNSLAQGHGLQPADTKPLLHYAKTIDVIVWPLTKLETK